MLPGKAVLIYGVQGGGKTLLAAAIAKSMGDYTLMRGVDFNHNKFAMSVILRPGTDEPFDTVIVEACDSSLFTTGRDLKGLVAFPALQVDRKGKDVVQVKTPNFIFIYDSDNMPDLGELDRRFIVYKACSVING